MSYNTDGTTVESWILKIEILKVESLKIETSKIETLKFEISCYLRNWQSTTASQGGNTEKKFRFYYFMMEI